MGSRKRQAPQAGRRATADVTRVAALVERAEKRVGTHQKLVERLTFAVGRPATLYLVVALSSVWITYNSLAPRFGAWPPDPPPFQWLQGLMSFAALVMTAMVLTTQNRLGADAQQRSQLDLHVNLLAEQKATKIIALLEELRVDLPTVKNRTDLEAQAMATSMDAESVASALEGNAGKAR